jgi:hypothetical protein
MKCQNCKEEKKHLFPYGTKLLCLKCFKKQKPTKQELLEAEKNIEKISKSFAGKLLRLKPYHEWVKIHKKNLNLMVSAHETACLGDQNFKRYLKQRRMDRLMDRLLDIEIIAIFAIFTILTIFSKEPYQLYVSGIGIGLGIGLALVHWVTPFLMEIQIHNKIMQQINR